MALRGEWRGFRRRCHRALLSALRRSDAYAPESAAGDASRTQPWLSELYGAVIASKRNRELARAARITAPSVPVISVGNVTFGATGKTPCVLLLTALALHHARDRASSCVPMLLTRGYGDDEWRLFHSAFPACKLAIGADRFRVGSDKAREFDGQLSCVVLDDGLQQWRIRKDLEVVMVDALHPFGNGRLIPHGSLREKPHDALVRADIVVVHHANLLRSRESLDALRSALLSCMDADRAPIIATSQMRVKRLVRARALIDRGAQTADSNDGDTAELDGRVALIVCGVGNPESVQLVIQGMRCGWHRVEMEVFPDHHMFSRADLLLDMRQRMAHLCAQTQREVVVVTTEKDFFRCEQLMGELAQSCDLRVLQCELELMENADVVRQRVLELLR